MKSVCLILLVSLGALNSCKTLSQTQKHKKVIEEVLDAVKLKDTSKIFSLIDTSSFFRVRGRQAFFEIIDQANKGLRSCKNIVSDSLVRTKNDTLYNVLEYTYPYCRGNKGELTESSFDLIFSFALYKNPLKVHFIDLVEYGNKANTPISIPH